MNRSEAIAAKLQQQTSKYKNKMKQEKIEIPATRAVEIIAIRSTTKKKNVNVIIQIEKYLIETCFDVDLHFDKDCYCCY